MGIANNVGFSDFPKQGSYLNKRVLVCFQYDTTNTILGTIVRDDAEEPGVAIIKTDDGRYVLTTECMWSPYNGATP